MHPATVHGLVNGALLGGAMALSAVGPLGATVLSNILFLSFALALSVSLLALFTDYWVMRTDNGPNRWKPENPAQGRDQRSV